MPPFSLTEKDGTLRFEVHAKPKAKRTAVLGERNDAVEVSIAAPPVDGAANDELVRFLAQRLGVARRDVEIVRGEAAQTKLIAVRGLDRETLVTRLFPNDA